MIIKSEFNGSPHLGVFCLVNDSVALVPYSINTRLENQIREQLDVSIVKTTLANTYLLGIFGCLNNSKILVPDVIEREELKTLKDHVPEVIILKEKYSALGNLITINDHGAICSTYIKSAEEIMGKRMKIADTNLIGSAVYANNSGFLTHRDANANELKEIETALKVSGDVGTMNFGDPLVKSGIIGNKKGLIVSKFTSGPEMQRIDEVFMLK